MYNFINIHIINIMIEKSLQMSSQLDYKIFLGGHAPDPLLCTAGLPLGSWLGITSLFSLLVLPPFLQAMCVGVCLHAYMHVYIQDKWMKMISQSNTVEICEPVNLVTLDVILRCAFSYKSNCQDSGYAINSYSICLCFQHRY